MTQVAEPQAGRGGERDGLLGPRVHHWINGRIVSSDRSCCALNSSW